jgi:hypothetical protein
MSNLLSASQDNRKASYKTHNMRYSFDSFITTIDRVEARLLGRRDQTIAPPTSIASNTKVKWFHGNIPYSYV